jgi:hypothetical protein
MERFDDLMGITHDTGDAWLDKKLNQNIAYIGPIAALAGGAALGLLSKPKSPKVAGGGIDPFLRPYLTPGLEAFQTQYEAGPRVFEGERVAGFDPAQLAAQSSLIALATGQPDYYDTAARSIEEAIALSRQAARPITAAEIAAQRELLEPTAEAQRLAQKQAFEETIRDIGLGAGGAGVGALEGARADILRGGAAGEFARSMADIEGRLQERAISQTEAERERQARLPSALAALAQQGLQVGQEGFAEQIERTGLQAGVGAERRGLEQQRIAAEMAKFAEADPFKYTQQYLGTVFGTPTLPTQIYQPQSTAQSILGGLTAVSGFLNKGGGISSLAEGGSIFSKEEEDEIKDIEDFSDEEFGTEYGKERRGAERREKIKKGLQSLAKNADALTPKSQMLGQQQGRSQQVALQQAARERMMRGLGTYNEGGTVNKKDGGILTDTLNRIIKGVQSGYQAVKNIEYDPETESLGKYDPFAGMDKTERLRIGLAMMSQMPALGQGPLQAAAAGAGPVLEKIQAEKLTEAEMARKKEKAALDRLATLEAANIKANVIDPKVPSSAILNTMVSDIVAGSLGAVVTPITNPVTGDVENIITIDGKAISSEQEKLITQKIAEGNRIYSNAYSNYLEGRTKTRPAEDKEYMAWVAKTLKAIN